MDIRIEKAGICESVREGGVEVARLSLFSLALDEKYKRINGFYTELCGRVKRWFFESYAEAARAEFLSSDEPKKEYRFRRYEYALDAEIRSFDGENLYIQLILREGKRSRGEKTHEKRLSQCWRISDEALLPLSAFVPQKRVQKTLLESGRIPDGFYLSEGRIVCFSKDPESGEYEEKSHLLAELTEASAKSAKSSNKI